MFLGITWNGFIQRAYTARWDVPLPCLPRGFHSEEATSPSPVIGFAADGFPIFGPFIADASGTIRRVTSSYILKEGYRVSMDGEGAFPGGVYDGKFRDDYEYVAGAGDLDECNGMFYEGSYGYYATDSFRG